MRSKMSRSNSENKMDVIVTRMEQWDDKYWVMVTLKNSRRFYPSFEDIYRIIRAICYCEDIKYPYGKGAEMVKEFLIDTCDGIEFKELKSKYKIPERNGDNHE